MSDGIALAGFYSSRPVDTVRKDALDACESTGFDVLGDVDHPTDQGPVRNVPLECPVMTLNLRFELDEDRDPSAPVLSIGCGRTVYPDAAADEADYRERMDRHLELLSRVAEALDVEYAPLFNPDERYPVPTGRHIGETLQDVPPIGVYGDDVLDVLGGPGGLFDHDPWYTATLHGDRTLVIESESPWTDGGWAPPTDALYFSDVRFGGVDESPGIDLREVADPFAPFETGEYGVDVCVPRNERLPRPDNDDDLRAVRVRVDENRDLRKVDSDAFVRHVGDEQGVRDTELAERMVDDAGADDPLVSVLGDGTVPPVFVRLDDPDGRNVLSIVMGLDTDVDKAELLAKLADIAREDEYAADDLESMETALETLADVDDVEGFDQILRNRFF